MAEAVTRSNVMICEGTGCAASQARELLAALKGEIARHGLDGEVRIVQTGCRGFCAMGPIVMVYPEGIFYCQVKPEDVPHLVEETLVKGRIVERLAYKEPLEHRAIPHYSEIPFYTKQKRIALRNCGMIDPEDIREYVARDGYAALTQVLERMTPSQVLAEMKASGLRGRGGAGFPTGLKWEFTSRSPGEPKYVVCNADEGDPGAFMDRSIIEGDPHSLLEGMTIAGYAIGARQGYVYCRAEYPLAIKRLHVAIGQARELGLLGANILGSDFSFDLEVKEGAGAFVCGEETALLASIEGRRGEPRPRPPFPAVAGLWGKPTNLNNVKSYAMTPQIILNGAEWFAGIGSPQSPGTAIFALTGKVRNTGLVEVPMGITLGEIIYDIGGGVLGGRQFKAVQTGGPLGGCIPPQFLNVKVDFDSLREVGAVMGSGGMIVVDEDTCMVEFAKFFLTFATAESCGKCVPCRAGGKRMLEILTRICAGKGRHEDLATLRKIAEGMETAALCALGQLTPGPVMAALRYFEHEFMAHIEEHRCPAGACKELVPARCLNACPAGVDVPAYVSLAAEGRFAEALAVHRERNPFALICGRVCPAFCEQRCRRGDIDEPVAIRTIKRFMADAETAPWHPTRPRAAKAGKVAVIGAGPAGLTAALRLAQDGWAVTVFEALPVPGGMMAVGIPEYRLPRDILNLEIDHIRRAGVEIRCNQALGRDFSIDELMDRQGYRAVVMAIGAHRSLRLGIPGEDRAGVVNGIDFLREVALGRAPDVRGPARGGHRRRQRRRGRGAHGLAPGGGRGAHRLPPHAGRHAGLPRGDRGRGPRGHRVPLPDRAGAGARPGQGHRPRGPGPAADRVRPQRAPTPRPHRGGGAGPGRRRGDPGDRPGDGQALPARGRARDQPRLDPQGRPLARDDPAGRLRGRGRRERAGLGDRGRRPGQPRRTRGGPLPGDRRARTRRDPPRGAPAAAHLEHGGAQRDAAPEAGGDPGGGARGQLPRGGPARRGGRGPHRVPALPALRPRVGPAHAGPPGGAAGRARGRPALTRTTSHAERHPHPALPLTGRARMRGKPEVRR